MNEYKDFMIYGYSSCIEEFGLGIIELTEYRKSMIIMKDVAQINHMVIIDVKFVTVEHGYTQDEAIEKFLVKNSQFKNIKWKKERKIINKASRLLDYLEERLKMELNNEFPYPPLIEKYKKQIKEMEHYQLYLSEIKR